MDCQMGLNLRKQWSAQIKGSFIEFGMKILRKCYNVKHKFTVFHMLFIHQWAQTNLDQLFYFHILKLDIITVYKFKVNFKYFKSNLEECKQYYFFKK